MTNGEKLEEIFPNLEYEVIDNTVLTNIDNGVWFSLDWWNAEYKEPRKGYLSIDDVMEVFDDFMCGEVDEDGIDTFVEMLRDKADMREVEE